MEPNVFSPADPLFKIAVPAVLIAVFFIVARIRQIPLSDLMLVRPDYTKAIVWTGIYIVYMLSTDFILNWRGDFDFTLWRGQFIGVSAGRILAVCFLGPVAEELIFRGLLFNRLRTLLKNEWVTILLISVIWSFLHLGYDIRTNILIIGEGILLGAAMLRSRSLYVPVLLHIIWNLYAVW